jgi:hypothetical protein
MKTSKQARPLLGCSLCVCLFFLCLGCEEIEQASLNSCLALLDECDAEIVPQMTEGYCLITVGPRAFGDDQRFWENCETFRRGQVCQCFTPVCADVVQTAYYQSNEPDEMDMLLDVLLLQCPDLDAYDYH